jgi:hypothetical protein
MHDKFVHRLTVLWNVYVYIIFCIKVISENIYNIHVLYQTYNTIILYMYFIKHTIQLYYIFCTLSNIQWTALSIPVTSENIYTILHQTDCTLHKTVFFIAMTVEIKAKHTVYKLCMRFIMHNTEWAVESYDRNKDPELNKPPKAQYV